MTKFFAVALATAMISLTAPSGGHAQGAFTGAPEGFIPPPLDPGESELVTHELSPGVYALLSTAPPVDNSGFIVGERGVLVVDAHINGAMAGKIIAAVRAVTDKPILYLVNTNYHGDHTFGNAFFPAETQVIAHAETARHMAAFEQERGLILAAVGGRADVIEGVTLRLPDITFTDNLVIDLGGRTVELHHFGYGNTAGDVVVYAPEAKAAWTGNFIVGEGFIPLIFEPVTRSYLASVKDMAAALEVATIIPGHGRPTDAATLGIYQAYLSALIAAVRAEIERGQTDGYAVVEAVPYDDEWKPAPGTPEVGMLPVLEGFHRLNVLRTFEDLTAATR